MYVFRNLTKVQQLTELWMAEYNDEHPHDSLEDLTPWKYLAKHQQAESSNQRCNEDWDVYSQPDTSYWEPAR